MESNEPITNLNPNIMLICPRCNTIPSLTFNKLKPVNQPSQIIKFKKQFESICLKKYLPQFNELIKGIDKAIASKKQPRVKVRCNGFCNKSYIAKCKRKKASMMEKNLKAKAQLKLEEKSEMKKIFHCKDQSCVFKENDENDENDILKVFHIKLNSHEKKLSIMNIKTTIKHEIITRLRDIIKARYKKYGNDNNNNGNDLKDEGIAINEIKENRELIMKINEEIMKFKETVKQNQREEKKSHIENEEQSEEEEEQPEEEEDEEEEHPQRIPLQNNQQSKNINIKCQCRSMSEQITLSNLFQSFQKSNHNSSSFQLCHDHHFPSTTYCIECASWLCSELCLNHNSSHKIKNHHLIANELNIICRIHHNKFTSYCNKCKINLCSDCIKIHHKSHIILPIQPMNDARIKQLKSDLTKVKKDSLDEYNNILDEYQNKINKILEKIDTFKQNYEINQAMNNQLEKLLDVVYNTTMDIKDFPYYQLNDLWRNIIIDQGYSKQSNGNSNKDKIEYLNHHSLITPRQLYDCIRKIDTKNNDNQMILLNDKSSNQIIKKKNKSYGIELYNVDTLRCKVSYKNSYTRSINKGYMIQCMLQLSNGLIATYSQSTRDKNAILSLWETTHLIELTQLTIQNSHNIITMTELYYNRLAAIANNGMILVYDLKTLQCLRILNSPDNYHYDIIQLQSGNRDIITCTHDKTILIWDRLTLQLKKTLTGHDNPVVLLKELSAKYNIIASISYDNTIRLWNVNDDQMMQIDIVKLPVPTVSDVDLQNIKKKQKWHDLQGKFHMIFFKNRKLIVGSPCNDFIIYDVYFSSTEPLIQAQVLVNIGQSIISNMTMTTDNKLIVKYKNKKFEIWNYEGLIFEKVFTCNHIESDGNCLPLPNKEFIVMNDTFLEVWSP